jgi:predicted RNA-binding protein with PUA-like domain
VADCKQEAGQAKKGYPKINLSPYLSLLSRKDELTWSSVFINRVNEFPQATELFPIKMNDEPWKMADLRLVFLFR